MKHPRWRPNESFQVCRPPLPVSPLSIHHPPTPRPAPPCPSTTSKPTWIAHSIPQTQVVKFRLGADVSSQSLLATCMAIGSPPGPLAGAPQTQGGAPGESPKAAPEAAEMGNTPHGFAKFKECVRVCGLWWLTEEVWWCDLT